MGRAGRTQERLDWQRIIRVVNGLVFEVIQESDGGYCAECLTESVFTQAASWDELRRNVTEAVTGFFFDWPAPANIRLRLVRDEVFQSREDPPRFVNNDQIRNHPVLE